MRSRLLLVDLLIVMPSAAKVPRMLRSSSIFLGSSLLSYHIGCPIMRTLSCVFTRIRHNFHNIFHAAVQRRANFQKYFRRNMTISTHFRDGRRANARFRAQIFLFHILVNQQFSKLLVAHSHSSIPPDKKSALLLGRTPLRKAAKSNNSASQRCILLYQNRMENTRK